MKTVFKTPTSLDDAHTQRDALIDEIAAINLQLSDRNKTHPNGVRWSDQEFHAWRVTALGALRSKESVLRKLNRWIRSEQRNTGQDTLG